MADFPSLDLLSEVEDLTMYVDGKSGSKFNLIDFDDENVVELNTGIPSHGLMNDADAMLAVDSSNALLGDPLLNFFDQNELLELQSASTSYIPETLMPVSLPADSPTHRSAADPGLSSCITTAGPEGGGSAAPSCSQPTTPELERTPVVCSQPTTTELERTPVLIISRGSTTTPPVRIVVKTRKQPVGKMVAPLTLQKPARNLVKIPKMGPSTSVVRMQAIRSGGKLGPAAAAATKSAAASPPPPPPAAASTSGELVQVPATSPTPSCSDTRIPNSKEHPFRSLRVRHSSETSSGSLPSPPPPSSSSSSSCGSKRKAYELDPQPDPQMERCRLNAINAKRNREMKKAHLADLERKVVDVIRERDQLAGENESLREAKQKLEQQVKHLSNILKNQSKLSALIGKLGPSSVVLGDVSSSSGSEDEIITSASGR